MKEVELEAKIEKLDELLSFIDSELIDCKCPKKSKQQLDVAAEEIFTNICKFAYKGGAGRAIVKISCDSRGAELTFVDKGQRYNPLDKADPDITLSAEDREIGGLGIYIVKKTMTKLTYEYREQQNILTIKKDFE